MNNHGDYSSLCKWILKLVHIFLHSLLKMRREEIKFNHKQEYDLFNNCYSTAGEQNEY